MTRCRCCITHCGQQIKNRRIRNVCGVDCFFYSISSGFSAVKPSFEPGTTLSRNCSRAAANDQSIHVLEKKGARTWLCVVYLFCFCFLFSFFSFVFGAEVVTLAGVSFFFCRRFLFFLSLSVFRCCKLGRKRLGNLPTGNAGLALSAKLIQMKRDECNGGPNVPSLVNRTCPGSLGECWNRCVAAAYSGLCYGSCGWVDCEHVVRKGGYH